jgi:hypothetical protein
VTPQQLHEGRYANGQASQRLPIADTFYLEQSTEPLRITYLKIEGREWNVGDQQLAPDEAETNSAHWSQQWLRNNRLVPISV